ncbi:MAG TPA: hypothetical protein DD856_09940 [Sulfobacillus sp.]|nr:hypothetical protein [Sulfobacillus sp.]
MVSRREVPVKNPAKPHKQKGEKAQFLPENGEHIVVEGFSERGCVMKLMFGCVMVLPAEEVRYPARNLEDTLKNRDQTNLV